MHLYMQSVILEVDLAAVTNLKQMQHSLFHIQQDTVQAIFVPGSLSCLETLMKSD